MKISTMVSTITAINLIVLIVLGELSTINHIAVMLTNVWFALFGILKVLEKKEE